MTCRENQSRFVLSLYDELTEIESANLETHLKECSSCMDAFDTHKTLHLVITEDAASWEVPADLLVESRRALANELDRVETRLSWSRSSWARWWRVPRFSVVLTPMRMLESATLIAMGLALGVYVSQREPIPPSVPQVADTDLSSIPANATISNLRIVNADAGTVELTGEVVQPLTFRGRREDEIVQRLLVSALRDADNPGARLRAAEVLGQKSSDQSVKEALIQAMVHDENAGVRLQALEALKPFVQDTGVREAFVQSVRIDKVPGIRLAAVEALNGLSTDLYKDETMAKTIQEATRDDDNAAVRIMGMRLVGNRQ